MKLFKVINYLFYSIHLLEIIATPKKNKVKVKYKLYNSENGFTICSCKPEKHKISPKKHENKKLIVNTFCLFIYIIPPKNNSKSLPDITSSLSRVFLISSLNPSSSPSSSIFIF